MLNRAKTAFYAAVLMCLFISVANANPHDIICPAAGSDQIELALCDVTGKGYCPALANDKGGANDQQDIITISGVQNGSMISFNFRNASGDINVGEAGGIALAADVKGQGNGDPSPSNVSLPAPNSMASMSYNVGASDGSSVKFQVKFDPSGQPNAEKVIIYSVSCSGGAGAGNGLSIVKSADVSTYSYVGQIVTYTYQVTNNTGGNVGMIRVDDDKINGGAPFACEGNGMGNLANGATRNCQANYTVTQTDINNGSIVNTAFGIAKPTGNNPDINSPSDVETITYVAPNASLSLSKEANLNSWTNVGTIITYTFTVTNTGNVTISTLDIADSLEGAPGFSGVTCPMDFALAPGESDTCSATYETQAGDDGNDIVNMATASGTDPGDAPVDSNEAQATVTFDEAGTASLSLNKTADVSTWTDPGTTITYTFTVTNTGTLAVSGIDITDSLESETGFSGISCPANFALAPGENDTCSATYVTQPGDIGNDIVNTATATGTDPSEGAVESDPDEWTTAYGEPSATLSLEKTANLSSWTNIGTTITYTFTITNTGNVTISSIDITDSLEGAPGFSGVTCPADLALAPGESDTCSATYETQAGDDGNDIVNTATANGEDPETQAVQSNESEWTVTFSEVGVASLTLAKTASAETYSGAGLSIVYSFLVGNSGTKTVYNITIEDALPGLSAISCPQSSLESGQNMTCTASYITTGDDVAEKRDIENTATAEGTDSQEGGEDVVSEPDTAIVDYEQADGAIELVKEANQPFFTDDDSQITYSYLVTNTGSVVLTDIRVDDDRITDVTCEATTLAPGAATSCTGTYDIRVQDIAAGQVTNTAVAYGTLNSTDDIVSEQASVTLDYMGTSIRDKADEISSSFILHRMDRILSEKPDRATLERRRHDNAWGGSGFELSGSGASGTGMDVRFGASLRQALKSKPKQDSAFGLDTGQQEDEAHVQDDVLAGGASPESQESTERGFDLWLEGHISFYDVDEESESARDGDFAILYIGGDYQISRKLLVGLLAQVDFASEEVEGESRVEGTGWMVGPYISVELTEGIFFDARAAWGRSSNDMVFWLSDIGFSGSFKTERWLLHGELSGNWTTGDWRFTPELSFSYIHETRKRFTVSDVDELVVTEIMPKDFALGRFSFGPEVAYRIQTSKGFLEPHVAVRVNWDFTATGEQMIGAFIPYHKGVRGEVEAGLIYANQGGAAVRLTAKYDGIGDSAFSATSVNLWVSLPF